MNLKPKDDVEFIDPSMLSAKDLTVVRELVRVMGFSLGEEIVCDVLEVVGRRETCLIGHSNVRAQRPNFSGKPVEVSTRWLRRLNRFDLHDIVCFSSIALRDGHEFHQFKKQMDLSDDARFRVTERPQQGEVCIQRLPPTKGDSRSFWVPARWLAVIDMPVDRSSPRYVGKDCPPPMGSVAAIEDAVQAAIEAQRPAAVTTTDVKKELAKRWLGDAFPGVTDGLEKMIALVRKAMHTAEDEDVVERAQTLWERSFEWHRTLARVKEETDKCSLEHVAEDDSVLARVTLLGAAYRRLRDHDKYEKTRANDTLQILEGRLHESVTMRLDLEAELRLEKKAHAETREKLRRIKMRAH